MLLKTFQKLQETNVLSTPGITKFLEKTFLEEKKLIVRNLNFAKNYWLINFVIDAGMTIT